MVEMRPIPEWPGYFAGEDGVIYSTHGRWQKEGDPPRPLKPGRQTSGYLLVGLTREGHKALSQRVHRLVCAAWHGPCPEGKECSHLDDDKENNRPENLKWERPQENQARRRPNGIDDRGAKNSRASLTDDQVRAVRQRLQAGETTVSIAKSYGVSRPVISRVKNGRRYQHDGR